MDPTVKLGWHWVEIHQLEHIKRGERHHKTAASPFPLLSPPLPSLPSSSYQRSHWENWMWFVCVFLKRGAHKQPWKGPLYSAREPRCASLGRPFVFPSSQNLNHRKKSVGGFDSLSVCKPKWCHKIGARFGWKRLQKRLKWFKRCRRELPANPVWE